MPIDPPDRKPPPKWALTLVNAAKQRNRARGSNKSYSIDDLIAAWGECHGRCDVSGLPFTMQIFGDGQAKRPFAPSLDRINRHKPYQKGNVRLVVSIANFAMNAWGDEPLLQLASAVHKKHGDLSLPARRAPLDSALDDVATMMPIWWRRRADLSGFHPDRTCTNRSWIFFDRGHNPPVRSRMCSRSGSEFQQKCEKHCCAAAVRRGATTSHGR